MTGTIKRTTRARGAVTAVAMAAMLTGLAAPAQASPQPEAAPPAAAPVLIDFGNGFTGSVDPQDNRLTSITTPTPLQWDADVAEKDFYSFGNGWTLGTYFLDSSGFYLPGVGTFQYDESWESSHLHGYTGTDFIAQSFPLGQPQVIPARGDIPEQEAYWTLTQVSTGVTAYFDWEQRLVAAIAKSGARTDWVFTGGRGYLIERIVEPNGDTTYFAEPPGVHEWAVLMPNGTTEHFLTLLDEKTWRVQTAENREPLFETESRDTSGWGITSSAVTARSNIDGSRKEADITWLAGAPRGTVVSIYSDGQRVYPVREVSPRG